MNQNDLSNLALSENGFLFDTVSGNSFTLNKTAKLIVKGLIGGDSPERIVSDLTDCFDVSEEVARSDVQQFIHHLKEMHVIPRPDIQS